MVFLIQRVENKKKILVIFWLFISVVITCEGAVDYYGLTFRSHKVNQDERTSLCLTPGKPYNLSPGFSLEFDLQLRRENIAFGYVFRIISGDTITLDLMSNTNTNKITVALVGQRGALARDEIKCLENIKNTDWIHIRIDLTATEIEYQIDDISKKLPCSFPDFKNIKIYFGTNKHLNFYTTDLPPMTVKDVILRDNKGDIIRKWALAQHGEDEVYDEIKNSKAVVLNGIWNIEEYIRWQKMDAFALKELNPQIATDPQQNRVFIATQDTLYIYHLLNGYLERIKTRKGSPYTNGGGSQLIYDPVSRRLFSYSVEYPHFLTYDFELNEWSAEKESESNLPLTQHHNRFIDPDTGQLILFGGYGNHTYNSNVLTHPLTGGKWSVDSLLPEISPRYLSAIGYYGNEKFLLMGGFGSPSGRQEDSPINLYDLYEVDYKNKKVKKLADLPKGEVPHTMGASLVIDTVSRKVYTLAYNNEEFQSMIYLLSVDLNTMAQTVLGEPFPYRFLDRESFCDLFLSPSEKKLYTVVLQGGVEGVYDVEFYSLRYAPLQVSDVIQKGEEKNNLPLIIALAGIVLLLLFGGFVYKQKRKNVTKPDQPDSLKPASEATLTDTTIVQEKPASTIFLLGGFRVFNKQAEDITGNFSLIKKQLFVFFLLNSTGDGKGVTTNKLDETFWAEMDKTKAANNRNVNIRNLRILLKTVGKIDIVHENGYWRLILGKDVTCDYYNAIDLIKRLNQKNSYSNEILNQLLDCTSKGLLLPNISTEWTDDYKGAFSNHLIDLLVKISTQEEIRTDPLFRLHIANVILIHDNLNEEAVRTKCRILYKQGKKGLSKQTFDLFCTSYLNILNEKPAFNYDDFVKNL